MRQNVTILATGGTIASTEQEGGKVPTKTIENQIKDLPLPDSVHISYKQIGQVPSPELSFETLHQLANRIQDSEENTDGSVVLHGTDTMEETAYYLDLSCKLDVPIILTGSQRTNQEPSPDGPRNIMGAIRMVASEKIQGSGVFVYFDDTLHYAREATKRHTYRLDAFGSSIGPVASLEPAGVQVYNEIKSRSVYIPNTKISANVGIVKPGLGSSGHLISSGRNYFDGFIVEAPGTGNTTAQMADAIERMIEEECPVVITTRCQEGPVVDMYGSDGGGKRLKRNGAIFSDNLPSPKARIKLLLALSHSYGQEKIESLFKNVY